MNMHGIAASAPLLKKVDATAPALVATGRESVAIKAGTIFNGRAFDADTPVELPPLKIGEDYGVMILGDGTPTAVPIAWPALPDGLFGGFHYAPGGNAPARSGGDKVAAINPCSLWDLKFRPSASPHGATLVELGARRFWRDIYPLCVNHLMLGTSRYGVPIAHGRAAPQKHGGGDYSGLDYDTAVAVFAHHGKQLPSYEECVASAYGVTECSSCGDAPELTGLDAPRTSKWGLMAATGNRWEWCHDGDPDDPRASIFGGSWMLGRYAGSRYANLVTWPEYSDGYLGARGRSDHLQLD